MGLVAFPQVSNGDEDGILVGRLDGKGAEAALIFDGHSDWIAFAPMTAMGSVMVDQGGKRILAHYAGLMSLADENAEVLEGIAARGTDLSVPRLVDFAHVFFSEAEASRFKDAAENAGYQVSMEQDASGELWDVIASSKIMPSVEQVTRIEEGLDSLARSFGGQADGWGFLED